jgi:hypothetical protein
MTLADTFRLVISDSQDWWVVYCGMVVLNGVIQTTPGSISIFTSDAYLTSTPTYVYFKLAELQTYYNVDGYRYVGWILNSCAIPFVAGGGTVKCFFQCSDASESTTLKVQVAQNLIAGRYPDGMGIDFPAFKLDISGNCYIYAAIYWDIENLVIGPDDTAITILQSNELLQNTDTLQYILLATVETGGSPLAITKITNVCTQPVPNPCLLDWSA